MKLEKKKPANVDASVAQGQISWYKNRGIQMKILGSIVVAILATLPLWESFMHPDLYVALENLLRFLINMFDV